MAVVTGITRKIDYNRGVHIMIHAGMGMDIFMYVDDPGVYFNAHGMPVVEELARQAGFPVDEYRKEREIRRRKSEAAEAIDAEFERQATEPVLHAERAGFKIMNMGVGRFKVYGPEGEELHKNYLPEDVAVGLLDKLAPLTPAEDE